MIEHEYNDPDDEISLLDLSLVLVRNLKLIAGIVFVCLAAGLTYALVQNNEYTASAKVIREAGDGAGSSGLGGLSALSGFGINLGGDATGLSVDSYPEILKSREVRLDVVKDTLMLNERTYLNYVSRSQGPFEDDTERQKEERAIGLLLSQLQTAVDRESGLMTISVTTERPDLSAALVDSFVRHLTERVASIRTEKGRLNLAFLTGRFEEARSELLLAETELAEFLDRT